MALPVHPIFAFRDFQARAIKKFHRMRGLPKKHLQNSPYALKPSQLDQAELKTTSELASIFFTHKGPIIHKWVHYLDIYDRYFSRFRGTDFRMLEIGVFMGGSLHLWRKYFGQKAIIFGIDINPECSQHNGAEGVQVRIGSQDDTEFLHAVVEEMGGVDIILDDGSHYPWHQKKSFDALFNLLNEGGLYVIEDLHASYWPGYYKGGYNRTGTVMDLIRRIINDMHAWYHDAPTATSAKTDVSAVHVHDSIVVIEKNKRNAPHHIQVGG